MQDWKTVLDRFAGMTVVVWGDWILDRYLLTRTGRISREAPVLIAEYESEWHTLGGAGNVARNCHRLGARVVPLGLIGADQAATDMDRTCRELGMDPAGLLVCEGYQTPCKTRVLAGGEHTRKQQVLRIDRLDRKGIGQEDRDRMRDLLVCQLDRDPRSLVLVSDYLEQAVDPDLFAELRHRFPHAFWAVDSRQRLKRFAGASLMTPNEPEFRAQYSHESFATPDEWFRLGQVFHQEAGADFLLLKRGQEGMLLFGGGKDPRRVGIHGGRDIVDVTGAGDTVLAVSAMALRLGADLDTAARLAAVAAGLVVMREGVWAPSREELEDDIKKSMLFN